MRLTFSLPVEAATELGRIRLLLHDFQPGDINEVELNLDSLERADSSFLSELLKLHLYMEDHDIDLRLRGLNPTVRAILSHSSLDRFLERALAGEA